MKKKLFIDLILFILLLLVMQYDFTGSLWHEIIGLIMFGIFIVHLLFNKEWLSKITNNLETMNSKVKTNYYLDVISIVVFIICSISGILISKCIFTFNVSSIWVDIHTYSTYGLLFLIIFHLLLHFKQVTNYLIAKLGIKNAKLFKTFSLIIFIALMFITIKNLFFKKSVVEDTSSSSNTNTSSSSKSNSSSSSSSSSSSGGTTPTLQQYLSTLHCGQCHNNCLLSAIKCSRGESKKEAATEDYNEKYSVSVTVEESNTLTSSDGNYSVDI